MLTLYGAKGSGAAAIEAALQMAAARPARRLAPRRQRSGGQRRTRLDGGAGRAQALYALECDGKGHLQLTIASRDVILRCVVDIDVRVGAVILHRPAHIAEPE